MDHGNVAGNFDSNDATNIQETKPSAIAVGHLAVRHAQASRSLMFQKRRLRTQKTKPPGSECGPFLVCQQEKYRPGYSGKAGEPSGRSWPHHLPDIEMNQRKAGTKASLRASMGWLRR